MPNQHNTFYHDEAKRLMSKGYLDRNQAAQRLGVPLRTLRYLVTYGKIEVIRVSPRIVLFDPAVIDAKRSERLAKKFGYTLYTTSKETE